jgi:lipoic acid synthetase
MVGLGETTDEILETLADLRAVGCDILTIGQYLAPTDRSAPVLKYYPPEEFDALAEQARSMGFLSVASGPFVRSSYNAKEIYEQASRS